MRILGGKPHRQLQQAVGFFSAHDAILPETIQGHMRIVPLFPQGLIRQCPHRQKCFPVRGHIAVTGGIPSADIVFGIRVRGLVTLDHAGRAKIRLGTADRASDVDSFHVNLLSVSDILERGCKVMNL